uniref:Uncharacterized protein n=1 Tax=Cacopsylla melanoneura TaxID=428564 RepID=A0A8D8LYD8_9HEMI
MVLCKGKSLRLNCLGPYLTPADFLPWLLTLIIFLPSSLLFIFSSSSPFFFFPASSSSDRVILGGVLLPRDSFLLNPRPSRASVALTTLLSDPLNVSKRTVSSTTGNTDLRYSIM